MAQAEFSSAEHVKSFRGPRGACALGSKTGYLARYAKMVTSADKGAILDF